MAHNPLWGCKRNQVCQTFRIFNIFLFMGTHIPYSSFVRFNLTSRKVLSPSHYPASLSHFAINTVPFLQQARIVQSGGTSVTGSWHSKHQISKATVMYITVEELWEALLYVGCIWRTETDVSTIELDSLSVWMRENQQSLLSWWTVTNSSQTLLSPIKEKATF